MDLTEIRVRIDEIDEGITRLFLERMAAAENVARFKLEKSLPVFDPVRERAKLDSILEKISEDMKPYVSSLYLHLFKLSRDYQEQLISSEHNRGK